MKRRRSEFEQDFVVSRVALFRCGHDGCAYTFEGSLEDWLLDREAHRFAQHPGWNPKKRKVIGSGANQRIAA